MLLRVLFSSEDIRKLRLDRLPETIEDLKSALRSKLNIEGAFCLQYEDPDFGNAFSNLTCPKELPPEKATLKVICQTSPTDSSSTDSSQSDWTHDTASLSSSDTTLASNRSQHWPVLFVIPSFSYDVELRLRHGNEKYVKDGSLLIVSKDVKTEVLDRLADVIYSFKAYPSNEEFESVAMALTEKHPCLKEPGSASGWYGWKLSLKFKMGNFRNKLREAGCPELTVNREKSQDGSCKRTKLKKPRKSETNFLPDLPEGKSLACLENERSSIQSEMKKRNPDWAIIDAAMDATFSLRRKEIVEDEPLVEEIKTKWPALFTPRQVACEFRRLVSVDLMKSFYEGLDQHLPKLLKFYCQKTSAGMPELKKLMQSLDKESSNQRRREAVLLGLPYFMRENPTDFFKKCAATDDEKLALAGVKIGILTVVEETTEDEVFPADVIDVAVVIEEQIVIQDLRDVSRAFAVLIGLVYALNLDYPKALRYSFEVIQRIFMKINGESCTARVHGLKNRLLHS